MPSSLSARAGAPASEGNLRPCPACGGADVASFIEIPAVPVFCNVLWPSRAEAVGAPRGDLLLTFCRGCGHVFNAAFDPARVAYTQAYENSLHFSPRFQHYVAALADDLIERYGVRGKHVVDVGCGKGEFLALLCERGGNRGTGFDPSYEPEEGDRSRPFTVVREYYSERHAGYSADLITCRHVLEHVEQPRRFVETVRRAVGDRSEAVVFFEVPNVLATLRDLAIWDLIYEHCSYFSELSLRHLFRSQGFEVLRVRETYGGQYLCLEAVPGREVPAAGDPAAGLERVAREVGSFATRYEAKMRDWRAVLDATRARGRRAALWGGGSKGVTLLNALDVRDEIPYVVDINPRKQGRFIAGTGQRIVSPDYLREYAPDVLILTNPLYVEEVRATATELGLSPEFMLA